MGCERPSTSSTHPSVQHPRRYGSARLMGRHECHVVSQAALNRHSSSLIGQWKLLSLSSLTAACDGADFLLQVARVDSDLHIEHADRLHALIKHRDVGGADLLALNVEHAIRHRQRVHDVGRSDYGAGERFIELQGVRFVERHYDVPHAATLFTHPRLRLSGAKPAGPDHERRGNEDYRDDCCAQQRDELAAPHSITSSATESSVGGTVSPINLAVSALMTNSNFVGCTTGRSAGFAPLRMRPTYVPA